MRVRFPSPALGRAEVRKRQRAVRAEREAGIVRDLPEVAVRVGEIAGVPAVAGLRRRLSDAGARGFRGGKDGVDLLGGTHVVRECNSSEGDGRVERYARVVREVLSRPEHNGEPARLEENRLL